MQRTKLDDEFKFPSFVLDIINELKLKSSTLSIWFVGSRANSIEREDSDWDLLVFVDEVLSPKVVHDKRVDIIVVDKNGNYFLEGQNEDLLGEFKCWNWDEKESGIATYKGIYFKECNVLEAYDSSICYTKNLYGYRLWSSIA